MTSPTKPGGMRPEPPIEAEFRAQKELSPNPLDKPLTFQEETFIREYFKDFCFERAARRAGYDQRNARVLLQQVHVRKRMDQVMHARSNELEMDHQKITRFLYNVLIADISEVMEHYRGCCRYCWGHDPKNPDVITHEYQYRHKRERMAARERHNEMQEGRKNPKPFPNGGLGYDQFRIPNPECPECNGEGISQVLIKDTNASGPARHLVQSVNINSAGKVEVKLHDKIKAAELLMRHLGMLQKDNAVSDVNVNIEGGLAKQLASLAASSLEQLEQQIAAEAQKKINET